MREIYSFDKYKGYSVIVEQLENGEYEGVAFIHAHQNPPFYTSRENGESARMAVIEWIDAQ